MTRPSHVPAQRRDLTPISAADVPPISSTRAASDLITFANGTVSVP